MNCQCSRSTNTGVRGVAHSSFSIAVVLEKTAKIEGKKKSNYLTGFLCPFPDSILFKNSFSTHSLIITWPNTSNSFMTLDSIADLCRMLNYSS